jgi:hypothetical protein
MVQIAYTPYVNAKMIPVEILRGIRGGGMKKSSEGGEFNYDTFDCKNFSKCYNVPPPSPTTTIIIIINK